MRTFFESEHICFVEVSESLIPDYLRMVNDLEHVGRFIGGRTEPLSEEKERKWVREKLNEKASLFSMIEKRSGAFIGNIELMDPTETEAELGIAITAAMQDRGFGSGAIRAILNYAFHDLRLRRVFLKVYPDNRRAIHVYERCGFREYAREADDVFMEIVR